MTFNNNKINLPKFVKIKIQRQILDQIYDEEGNLYSFTSC